MNRSRVFWAALLLGCALLPCAPRVKAQAGGAERASASSEETARVFRRALYRHKPGLLFDSGEDFFPVKVDAITDNLGNKLVRDEGNALIAARENNEGELNIRYLRKRREGDSYPNGDVIFVDDHLDEKGSEVSTYIEDARGFQRHNFYRDRIYGRIVPVRDGDTVRGAWLQYWFFYYYDDFPREPRGDHEGDWEMIQVRVDVEGKPLYAVYAKHGHPAKCAWSDMDMDTSGVRPKVYVALGSHASYFHKGKVPSHGQDLDVDGNKPRPMRRLIRMSVARHPWINWPGFWGNSRGTDTLEATSPKGPKFQGDVWADPEAFYKRAEKGDGCN